MERINKLKNPSINLFKILNFVYACILGVYLNLQEISSCFYVIFYKTKWLINHYISMIRGFKTDVKMLDINLTFLINSKILLFIIVHHSINNNYYW